jgi:uncharacterized protein (TIGR00251 family)
MKGSFPEVLYPCSRARDVRGGLSLKFPDKIDEIPHRKTRDGIILSVRVEPRSSRARVDGVVDEMLKVKLTSPPVGGAANRQLVEVLSDFFGVRKSGVKILKGHSSKNKVIELKE